MCEWFKLSRDTVARFMIVRTIVFYVILFLLVFLEVALISN